MHNHRDEGKVSVKLLSHVGLCDPMGGLARALLSLGFFRQEYWSLLPFPSPDLPNPGIEPPVSYIAGGNLYPLSRQGSSIILMMMTVINRLCLGDEVKSKIVEKS